MDDLRDREEKYRIIVDNAGQGILLINRDTIVLEHNRMIAEWFPEIERGARMLPAIEGAGRHLAGESMADGVTRESGLRDRFVAKPQCTASQ